MAKTRAQLVYRALKNLGVLPSGQTPSAEEYNTVDDLVDPMIETLIALDIIFIEDVNAIDEKYFIPLGYILAQQAAAEFGMQNDGNLVTLGNAGSEMLEAMDTITQRYTHLRTCRTDYPVITPGSSSLFPTT